MDGMKRRFGVRRQRRPFSDRPATALAALSGVVRRSRAAILLERLLRAFWPLGSFLLAGWSVVAFGLPDLLSRGQIVVLVLAFLLVALVLASRGWLAFQPPTRAEALARMDADLPGRPIAALLDHQAGGAGDAASVAVWNAHRARMARLARAARPVAPDLRLARRDPWGLRLMALTMGIAALLFARSDGFDAVTAALVPQPGAAVAAGPSYEAWARPPAYTGRPTLYLPEVPGDRPVHLPEGTEITFRVYGAADDFTLAESVAETGHDGLADAAEGIAAARFALDRTGSVALRQGERTLGEWSFIMEPDEPPTIALAEPLARATGGATRLAWEAEDDHGVTGASAEIVLDLPRVDRRHGLAAEPVPREPLAVDLPMPLTGRGTERIEDVLVEDFSKHPWAGLPVRLSLTAEDALGQQGHDHAAATLPRRRFFDPVAAALVEQRRDLLWAPEANARRVTQILRAVTHRPEDAIESERAYLLTRTAIRWLARGQETGAIDAPLVEEVAEMLWQAALLIEEGGLGDAAERLARAQERLQEALRGDASDEEIAELMDELREATRDYMQRLAEEAIERGEQQAQRSDGPTMNQDQIQELMDRIQELSEQGRRAEAEALLEMLRQMLENMEMMIAEGGEGGQGGQGQQMMDELAETLRGQQDLADDSFQQLQREFRQNRMGQGGGTGEESAEGLSPEDLARRQEALREQLDALRQGLPQARGEAGEAAREALREAEREMGEARDRLEQGDTSGALDRQADAIDRLREGMRGLGEEMQQQAEAGGDGEGADAFAEGSDPLGRPIGNRGNIRTGETMVPEADARARARQILEEIRRRAGELDRPEVELDYLRRLLDRF
jgi:uncharacterized protein (TIGR02302 family)